MRRFPALLSVLTLLASQLAAGPFPNDCSIAGSDELVVNFHRVDADLYRGGRPEYRDEIYLQLAALGIRTVVNLEGSEEAQKEQAAIERVNAQLVQAGKPPLTFVSFPIAAFTETVVAAPSSEEMTTLFAEIRKAPKPIYLHCGHGKDRTGMVVLLYRLWRDEASFDEAYREARYYRFSGWNFGLKRTLAHYRQPEAVRTLGEPPASAATGVCKAPSPRTP